MLGTIHTSTGPSNYSQLTGNMDSEDLLRKFNDEMTQTLMPVTIFVGIEMVLGFFGNLLVLYVFKFHYHTCNFRYFVLCVSVIDFTSTLTTLPGEVVSQVYWYMFPSQLYCKIRSFFNMYTVTAEALCLMTIAVDRYRKVCTPTGWQIKPPVARILCLIDLACGFVLSLPVAILAGLHKAENVYMNRTVNTIVCGVEDQYVTSDCLTVYNILIQIITSIILFVMILLNALILKRLITNQIRRKYSKSDNATSAREAKGVDHSTEETTTSGPTVTSNTFDTETNHADDSENGYWAELSSVNDTSKSDKRESRTKKPRRPKDNKGQKRNLYGNARQKTKIMLILTVIFAITLIMYMTMVHFETKNNLDQMSNAGKATFLLFYRAVFINHVINPFVYGCLDKKFQTVVSRLFQPCR